MCLICGSGRRLRKVFMSNGTIITLAGNGFSGPLTNYTAATSSAVYGPSDVDVLSNNDVVVVSSRRRWLFYPSKTTSVPHMYAG
jgi:hypothetical protein